MLRCAAGSQPTQRPFKHIGNCQKTFELWSSLVRQHSCLSCRHDCYPKGSLPVGPKLSRILPPSPSANLDVEKAVEVDLRLLMIAINKFRLQRSRSGESHVCWHAALCHVRV